MGIEDGATLAETLERATNIEDIKRVLPAFEKIRKPHAELIASASAMLGKMWQMPDGEAQQQRDERIKGMPIWDTKTWDGTHIDEVPRSLRDPKYQTWVMGHNTIEFVGFPWLSSRLLCFGLLFLIVLLICGLQTNRQLDKLLA
jgi:salicylate hydroxylase